MDERDFFQHHCDFDRSHVAAVFANVVAANPAGANLVSRHRPIATLISEFFRRLRAEAKTSAYPAAELARAWSQLSQGSSGRSGSSGWATKLP